MKKSPKTAENWSRLSQTHCGGKIAALMTSLAVGWVRHVETQHKFGFLACWGRWGMGNLECEGDDRKKAAKARKGIDYPQARMCKAGKL